MQIDKLYASLKDLAQVRRQRLEETVKLLHRDIEDLEQWIADKVMVADSNELGQDFDHVNLLKERFAQFAQETQQIGQDRIKYVTQIANALIDAGHADSAVIAQWNEGLNFAWEDHRPERMMSKGNVFNCVCNATASLTYGKKDGTSCNQCLKYTYLHVTQPLPNNEQLLRQHAADVIIITNALASAGSSGSTSRLQQKQGKIHLSFLFFYFNIFSYVLIGLGDLAPILK
jgi:hypothetical protein